MDVPFLFEYPLGLRLVMFVVLVVVTLRCTQRGIHYGLLLGLVAGMNIFELFNGDFGGALPVVSMERFIWPLIFAVFFWKRWRGETAKLPFDRVEYSIIIFMAVMMLSHLVHEGRHSVPVGGKELTQLIRGFVIPFIIYFVARRGVQTNRQLTSFFIGIGLITGYLILTGIAEAFQIHDLVFPKFIIDPSRGTHAGRARGVFLNASFLGLAIAMALPIFVWLMFTDRSGRRWLWILLGILSALPLAYTIQRAAWICAAAAIAVTVLSWPGRRTILMSVLVGSLFIGVFLVSGTLAERVETKLGDENSIDFRTVLITRSLLMIRQSPITGIGLNRFKLDLPEYTSAEAGWSRAVFHSHNTVLTVFAELGVVGVIPYLAIFGFLFLESVQIYARYPEFRAIIGVLWGVSIAVFGMMMSVELRAQLYLNGLFFALWGIGLEATRRQLAEKYSVRTRRSARGLHIRA